MIEYVLGDPKGRGKYQTSIIQKLLKKEKCHLTRNNKNEIVFFLSFSFPFFFLLQVKKKLSLRKSSLKSIKYL